VKLLIWLVCLWGIGVSVVPIFLFILQLSVWLGFDGSSRLGAYVIVAITLAIAGLGLYGGVSFGYEQLAKYRRWREPS